MKQLSGLDAAFIHQDTLRTPMHITAVLFYGPDAEGNPLTLHTVRQALERALRTTPILTQKLLNLPMAMDEPYWQQDKNFDLDLHLDSNTLPAPGDWPQLKEVIAHCHGQRLNMARPLWQARHITNVESMDGMPAGTTVLLLKIHHAAVDGVTLARVLSSLHSEQSFATSSESPAERFSTDAANLWARSQIKQFTRPMKLANTVLKMVPAVNKMREVKKPRELPASSKRIKTRFNTKVSQERVIGAVQLSRATLKTIKREIKPVTLNDIAISLVGGALREYLLAHDELPPSSLVCGSPVNLRERNDDSTGNKIATMQVGLATDLADPIERARAVHQYGLFGREKIEALGVGTIMAISDSVVPAVLAEGLKALSFASTRVAEIPVPFHLMISNVPGSPRPASLGGSPLQSFIGLGPIRHSMGLFHVVTYNADVFSIAFSSCRSIMPDPEFYEQCLQNSFDSLCHAVAALD